MQSINIFSILLQMEIDLKNQIVILDEAHNIEDSAREAGSGSLTTDQITQAIHNLQELCELFPLLIASLCKTDCFPVLYLLIKPFKMCHSKL